jgi:transmembrane sensor
MSQADQEAARAREEASAWFAKLNRRQVSLTEIEAFWSWRDDPANRSAYEIVEQTWRGANALKGDKRIDEALSGALSRGQARGRRLERRRAWIGGASAAALIGLAGAGATLIYVETHPSFATHVGEQRLIRLADGSAVRLDTDSRIDVAFSARVRRVRLERGQALFEVAHDANRPFLAQAGPVTVRALGTKFDIRADHGQPTVTLIEGVVEVRRAGVAPQVWTLRPGERVATGAPGAPWAVNLQAATGWTIGRVVFQGVPLSAAVAEVNRYSSHKIVLNAPDVAAIPVTGSFDTGDASAFVSAVSDLHGLRVERRADGAIVLEAPGASPR